MRQDLESEKVKLEQKKKQKLAVLKQKKKEIMSKLYEDKAQYKPEMQPKVMEVIPKVSSSN